MDWIGQVLHKAPRSVCIKKGNISLWKQWKKCMSISFSMEILLDWIRIISENIYSSPKQRPFLLLSPKQPTLNNELIQKPALRANQWSIHLLRLITHKATHSSASTCLGSVEKGQHFSFGLALVPTAAFEDRTNTGKAVEGGGGGPWGALHRHNRQGK